MEQSCHIVCNTQENIFIILGHKNALVKQALLRLRATCFQIAAHQLDLRTQYLTSPQTLKSRSMIKMIRHEPSGVQVTGKTAYMRPVADDKAKFETGIVDPRVVQRKVCPWIRRVA